MVVELEALADILHSIEGIESVAIIMCRKDGDLESCFRGKSVIILGSLSVAERIVREYFAHEDATPLDSITGEDGKVNE